MKIFLKVLFHKFFLVHSWIPSPIRLWFFSVLWVFLGLWPWNLKDEHLNQHISKSKTRRYLKFMDEKSLNIRSNDWSLLQMIWCRKILSLFWNSGKNYLISFLYFLSFFCYKIMLHLVVSVQYVFNYCVNSLLALPAGI